MSDFTTMLLSQLMDPFRIGLLAALMVTTVRNSATTGWVLPLVAGAGFVAYVIATVFPVANQPLLHVTGVGLVSNAIILGVMLLAWSAYRRVQT